MFLRLDVESKWGKTEGKFRNSHGHKGFPLPEGELGHLSTQQEAWLNDVFLCQLVTEVTGFSKWVGRAAERKRANTSTSESLTQAAHGMWREDSLLPKFKQVVQPTDGLTVCPAQVLEEGWKNLHSWATECKASAEII